VKTLIIGCQGFIGRHLWKQYPTSAGTHRIASKNILPLDLSDPELKVLPLNWKEYSHAIICSAISKIGFCEREKESSFLCNVQGTLALARQLTDRDIFPIFFSSDYIFDGKNSPYDEESSLNPLNEYGRQKALLEQEIPKICGSNYLIIRLGKVFGTTPGDRTLLDEMVSSLLQGQTIRAAHDQVFSPIFLDDAIDGIIALQTKQATGLYQLCGCETWSRYDLACLVARSFNIKEQKNIHNISLDDLNEPFQRPKNTAMRNERFMKATGLRPRSIINCIQKMTALYTEREYEI